MRERIMHLLRTNVVPPVGRSERLRRILWQSPEFVAWASELASVRAAVTDDPEVRNQLDLAQTVAAQDPPLDIEVNVEDEVLDRLFDRIRSNWERLGIDDPYWSVLSSDEYRLELLKKNPPPSLFFESGECSVDELFHTLRRNHLDIARLRTCLEIGCGVGRLTIPLARRLEHVTGCDISSTHLDLARHHAEANGIDNTSFALVRDRESWNSLDKVDLAYTEIVLQHNPPPVIDFIIRRILAGLNPGGVAVFQVPTYFAGYSFDAAEYLATETENDGKIEMHAVPQAAVFRAAGDEGCEVLEVLPNRRGSPPAPRLSNTFVVRRRT